MGGVWLHDLPAIVDAAGLDWRTWQGWETRSRSSGGYNAVWAIGTHHTASSTTPDNDCSYMWGGSPDEPVGAMLLDRWGVVTIGAAGATNTQGKGGPRGCSRGTIPLDQGNLYTLSIEAANAGTGEPWTQEQQSAYVTLCAALCSAYGLTAGDVMQHGPSHSGGWTDRKIDPAGQSRWAQGSASWNPDLFRSDVAQAMGAPTDPLPPPGGPPSSPEGVMTMYYLNVTRQGWPGPAVMTMAADGIRWHQTGLTSALDRLAGVTWLDIDKGQLLEVLVDRPGIGPHPFTDWAGGAWADPELAQAWEG